MLKVGALVLLVLGVVAGVAGGVGLYVKPEANVTVEAPLSTAELVIPPEVVALVGEHTLTVEGDGLVEVRSARPIDAAAWLDYTDAAVLDGIATWERLAIREIMSGAVGEPEPSDDLWRTSFTSAESAELVGADVEAGVTVIVESSDGAELTRVALDWEREVGFGWVLPALSGGALLTAAGLVMLVFRFLDMRPAGEKVESAAAKFRKRGRQGPGIRRARREAAETEAAETEAAERDTAASEPAEIEEDA